MPARRHARPAPRTSGPPGDPARPPRDPSRALAVAAWILLGAAIAALHGRAFLLPFIADDFIFLPQSAAGSWEGLMRPFATVQNYFRPVGRELYFVTLSLVSQQDPRVFRAFNFAVILASVALVMGIGGRCFGPRGGVLAGAVYALFYPTRVELAWISCAQDLLATAFSLLALRLWLSARPWPAAACLLVALLSKESAIPLAPILTIWALWRPASPGAAPGTRILPRDVRPLWAATAAWAAIVAAARLARGAWAAGSSLPVADVSLHAGHAWEGYRSAILSYLYAEQPWIHLRAAMTSVPTPWPALVLVGMVALVAAAAARRADGGRETGAASLEAGGLRLGLIWALVGALPVALVGHHFSAYYASFGAVGFALFAGGMLARAPRAVAALLLLAATAMNPVANGTGQMRVPGDPEEPGVSHVPIVRLERLAAYLDSLRIALERDPPPRGAVIYLSHTPHQTRLATQDDRAPRIWFRDPTLDLTSIRRYRTGTTDRPKRFVRFDERDRSFQSLPESLVSAIVEGEDAMGREDWGPARAAMERALKLARPGVHDVERLELSNTRGVAANLMGDTATARRTWWSALAVRPGHPDLLVNLAGLAANQGRFAEARDLVREALRAEPRDPATWVLLMRLDRELGDWEAVREAWTRLVALNPAYAESVAGTPGRR